MDRVAEAIKDLVNTDPVWTEMIIQIVATILLILVVKFFFWEKLTNFIEGRRTLMDSELTEATQMNEEAKVLKQEAEQAFERVKQEAKEILEEAKTRGEDVRREMLLKAKEEAQNIKKSAQRDLAQEIELAKEDIRHEIVSVASLLAEKVIGQAMDEKTYIKLLDEAIHEVKKS